MKRQITMNVSETKMHRGESCATPRRGSLLCTAEKILAAPLSASRLFVASTAVFGAVFGAIADTTATYAKGDTSLLDGKVLIEYDGSENITKLAMAPGADEKLILTGDTLPFAVGAQIAFSASGGGTNIIANSFTTAGALEFAGPTNMTWGGGDYLPMGATYVTLFENVRLDDIVPIAGYGRMGNNTPTRDDSYKYTPFFIDRDEDSGTMRFELRNGKLDRCVFVEFAQDGDNIKGRVLESCYDSPADVQTRAFTYNTDGTVTVISGATVKGNRYTYQQQKWIDIGPRYGNAKLTFVVPCMTNMTWGGGAYLPMGSTYVTLFENVRLDDIVPIAGYGRMGNNTPTQSEEFEYTPFFIDRDEDSDTMRFELRNSKLDSSRCVFVEFAQDGDNIKGRVLESCYNSPADAQTRAFTYNTDGTVTVISGATVGSRRYTYQQQKWLTVGARKVVLPAISGSGAEVTFDSNAFGDAVGEFTSDYPATVNATGANTMVGAFIVKGDDAHPIVYDVAAKYAMPETIDCYGNATLRFSASGAYNDGVSKGTDTITMHDGTTIASAEDFSFHYDSGDVVLDGATLSFTKGGYLNFLTLMNGAKVDKSGGSINAGYKVDIPKWKITGTGKSTYTGDISIAAYTVGDAGVEKYLRIEVADTVEGDDTDFLLTGNISAWDDRRNASISKCGPGTMEVDGTIYTTNRAVRVVEGTLLLGRSNATAADVDFSLQGGTLAFAEGTANTVDAVALTADSGISVASGALLTMADLTIADGKVLNIVGDGKVRVLASLDSATLSRIRLNGRRASQSSTGYLCVGGFVILFR